MSNHTLIIKSIVQVTNDVLRIITSKPEKLYFVPGHPGYVAINKSGWLREERPFSLTDIPTSNSLEFTLKRYREKESPANHLLDLKEDDELILHDVFGAAAYKGEGVFIAGGAGITPFISTFRDLKAKNKIGNNKLIFANKTKAHIILEEEFKAMLGDNFINILSDEQAEGYHYGRVTEKFLKAHVPDFKQRFYICGSSPMIKEVEKRLLNLGADKNKIMKDIL